MGGPIELSVPGFKAASVCAGLKKHGHKDLAIFFSGLPTVSSVLFTKNRVQAAPIMWAKNKGDLRALRGVLVNSGNANACTGDGGLKKVAKISEEISKCLNLQDGKILISSTGVIGVPLPHKKIIVKLNYLCKNLSPLGFSGASKAIMTTDRFEKTHMETFMAGGRKLKVFGIAKGGGMIAPNMGTMLAFIFTDCYVDPPKLDKIFKKSVDRTFNRIIVDGDMSTNDTAAIFANGATLSRDLGAKELENFEGSLYRVLRELALKIVSDGEGATRVVKITVKGSHSINRAKNIAETIGTSLLVKTAIFGADLNWGRIVAAAGRAEVPLNPDMIEIYVDGIKIFGPAMELKKKNLKKAKQRVKNKYYEVSVVVGRGKGNYFIYTSDLTHEYVTINSEYTT